MPPSEKELEKKKSDWAKLFKTKLPAFNPAVLTITEDEFSFETKWPGKCTELRILGQPKYIGTEILFGKSRFVARGCGKETDYDKENDEPTYYCIRNDAGVLVLRDCRPSYTNAEWIRFRKKGNENVEAPPEERYKKVK